MRPIEPSKSQRQANAMYHATHDRAYGEFRKIPLGVATEQHTANIQEEKWGMFEGMDPVLSCFHCKEKERMRAEADARREAGNG